MNHSTPGLPVYHQLLESTQTHVHQVGDATQTSHPLSSPSPPALNHSQLQDLFKWVSSSHQVAKLLEFQLQHQSLQWTTRTDLLQDGLVGSPYSPRDSQESSPTPHFKSINSSALSFLYSPTLTSIHDHWKNHSLDQYGYACIYRYWYYVYISIRILCELMLQMFGRIWVNALTDYTQVVENFIYSLIHFCNSLHFLGFFFFAMNLYCFYNRIIC